MAGLMADVSANALRAVRKHYYLSAQAVIEGLVNLGLSIILAKRIGIYGVALGVAIPALVSQVIVQPIYSCRILGIGWPRYMSAVFLRPFLAFGLAYGLSTLARLGVEAPSLAALLLSGIGLVVVYVPLAFFVALEAGNRETVRRMALAGARRLLRIVK